MSANELLTLSIILMSLLAVIAVALIVLAVILIRRKAKPLIITMDTTKFDTELDRIMNSTAHAVEVSAVLGLMKQIDEDKDALELIKSYPETVRAAAWLHCINMLGADLQAAQKRLSDAHQKKGEFHGVGDYYMPDHRKSCQEYVDVLRAKLNKAIAASGQAGLRAVN